jgi:hypothetical protein
MDITFIIIHNTMLIELRHAEHDGAEYTKDLQLAELRLQGVSTRLFLPLYGPGQ